jgi:hypothetical protein
MAVTGEPSLGTPHKHYETLTSTSYATTGVKTITLSTSLPIDTKWMEGRMAFSSTAANTNLYICDSGCSEIYNVIRTQIASVAIYGHFSCPVTSRSIYCTQTPASTANIIALTMTRYWM